MNLIHSNLERDRIRPRARGRTLITVLLAALLPALTLQAGVIYQDSFDASSIETNLYLGNIISGGGYVPAETNGSPAWGPNADWNWAGVSIVSSNQWSFPTASEKYSIEWQIGPMTVTTPGAQPWGDIKYELLLVSANAVRNSGDAAEFWSAAKGVLGVDVVYENGSNPSVSFGWKNDTHPASSGKQTAGGQSNNVINPAISHTVRIEFTSADASLYVDGLLSQTVSLATMGLGNGGARSSRTAGTSPREARWLTTVGGPCPWTMSR